MLIFLFGARLLTGVDQSAPLLTLGLTSWTSAEHAEEITFDQNKARKTLFHGTCNVVQLPMDTQAMALD